MHHDDGVFSFYEGCDVMCIYVDTGHSIYKIFFLFIQGRNTSYYQSCIFFTMNVDVCELCGLPFNTMTSKSTRAIVVVVEHLQKIKVISLLYIYQNYRVNILFYLATVLYILQGLHCTNWIDGIYQFGRIHKTYRIKL